MKYRKLGTSDLQASVIAFGSWGAGGGSVWSDRTLSVADLSRLLDAAEDRGINYIDTAPVYGTGASEQLLGEALKGRRDRFILQTKCSLNWRGEGGNFHYQRDGYTVNNDTRPRAVRKDVEDSLRRLKTDMIDVIVVHYVCSSWPAAETMGVLMELVKEGKIRAVGLSNSRPPTWRSTVSTALWLWCRNSTVCSPRITAWNTSPRRKSAVSPFKCTERWRRAFSRRPTSSNGLSPKETFAAGCRGTPSPSRAK